MKVKDGDGHVYFIIIYQELWKFDTLYKALEQRGLSPVIVAVPQPISLPGPGRRVLCGFADQARQMTATESYFKELGYCVMTPPVLDDSDDHMHLSHDFLRNATAILISNIYRSVSVISFNNQTLAQLGRPMFFLGYGLATSSALFLLCYAHQKYTEFDFIDAFFLPTRSHVKVAKKFLKSHPKSLLGGYTILDRLSQGVRSPWPQDSRKKVIWAPHHTVNIREYKRVGIRARTRAFLKRRPLDGFFAISSFFESANVMLEIARRHQDDLVFCFRPHQLLKDTLYHHADWGKEKTDAYYACWDALPNVIQNYEKGYEDLMASSNLMVCSSASFLAEYAFLGKPLIFPILEKNSPWQRKFIRGMKDFKFGRALARLITFTPTSELEKSIFDHLKDADSQEKSSNLLKYRNLYPSKGRDQGEYLANAIMKALKHVKSH